MGSQKLLNGSRKAFSQRVGGQARRAGQLDELSPAHQMIQELLVQVWPQVLLQPLLQLLACHAPERVRSVPLCEHLQPLSLVVSLTALLAGIAIDFFCG
jgi:hypothetical protein